LADFPIWASPKPGFCRAATSKLQTFQKENITLCAASTPGCGLRSL
jgi:hypothetical protein